MARRRSVDPLLTPEGAAELLAIKPRMVRDWLRSGKLVGVKLGKVWRVRVQAVEKLVKSIEKERDRAK